MSADVWCTSEYYVKKRHVTTLLTVRYFSYSTVQYRLVPKTLSKIVLRPDNEFFIRFEGKRSK